MSKPIILGTRGSKLALAQSHWVADALRQAHPELDVDIQIIQTRGDATQAANIPLASFGEKGIFAKELEAALLAGEIDLAVHSMKDLEHTLPDGLVIAAVPPREDPRDALVGSTLDALPPGARVGTGSVRRRALLLSRCPDLQLLEIRGNVDTRLRKWREGQYDAICLAVAGLNRLGLQDNITEILDPDWFTPDPGQGALAIEIRDGDQRLRDFTISLNHGPTWYAVLAERSFLRHVGGSCKTPVGALATLDDTKSPRWLTLSGMVAAPDGTTILRHSAQKFYGGSEWLGHDVAEDLRAQGADRLLAGEVPRVETRG
ncbi:MAG: hydroxymethylbilane synthase [Janthinobacterium lividum]